MKYNFIKFIVITVGIISIYFYFFKDKFSEYNLEKSISACIAAKKIMLESFDLEKAKKFCKENVGKKK
jgi:hypothetical protein